MKRRNESLKDTGIEKGDFFALDSPDKVWKSLATYLDGIAQLENGGSHCKMWIIGRFDRFALDKNKRPESDLVYCLMPPWPMYLLPLIETGYGAIPRIWRTPDPTIVPVESPHVYVGHKSIVEGLENDLYMERYGHFFRDLWRSWID